MRRFLRLRLAAALGVVAVAALLLGGYRAATVRRHHYHMTAVNYEIYGQSLRLALLQIEALARSTKSAPSVDPGYAALKHQIDLHEHQAESYYEAARSPIAWVRLRPVARTCDCGFCDFIESRTFTPKGHRREPSRAP